METIIKKAKPSSLEKLRYIRYFIAEGLGTPEDALKKLGTKWGKDKVERLLNRINKEGRKPHPKRFKVSIREPLMDPFLK